MDRSNQKQMKRISLSHTEYLPIESVRASVLENNLRLSKI